MRIHSEWIIQGKDDIKIQGVHISNLKDADDAALLSKTEAELQEMWNKVEKISDRNDFYFSQKEASDVSRERERKC